MKHPELGLHFCKRRDRAEVGAQKADIADGGIVVMPNSADVGLICKGVGLATGGVLLGEEWELLAISSAEHDHVGLDDLILQTLVLRTVSPSEDDAAILGDLLGPRSEVNCAISSVGNRLLDDGLADALNDAGVENSTVRLADIGRGLARLCEEHCGRYRSACWDT